MVAKIFAKRPPRIVFLLFAVLCAVGVVKVGVRVCERASVLGWLDGGNYQTRAVVRHERGRRGQQLLRLAAPADAVVLVTNSRYAAVRDGDTIQCLMRNNGDVADAEKGGGFGNVINVALDALAIGLFSVITVSSTVCLVFPPSRSLR